MLYFQNKLKQYENDIKNTWNVMKTVIGKSKIYDDNFPKIIDINKKKSLIKNVAETFNMFFINVDSNLAGKSHLVVQSLNLILQI